MTDSRPRQRRVLRRIKPPLLERSALRPRQLQTIIARLRMSSLLTSRAYRLVLITFDAFPLTLRAALTRFRVVVCACVWSITEDIHCHRHLKSDGIASDTAILESIIPSGRSTRHQTPPGTVHVYTDWSHRQASSRTAFSSTSVILRPISLLSAPATCIRL